MIVPSATGSHTGKVLPLPEGSWCSTGASLLLFWAFLASYIIHILDETLVNGGFVQWIRDNFWPTYTWRLLFWFNAGQLLLFAGYRSPSALLEVPYHVEKGFAADYPSKS